MPHERDFSKTLQKHYQHRLTDPPFPIFPKGLCRLLCEKSLGLHWSSPVHKQFWDSLISADNCRCCFAVCVTPCPVEKGVSFGSGLKPIQRYSVYKNEDGKSICQRSQIQSLMLPAKESQVLEKPFLCLTSLSSCQSGQPILRQMQRWSNFIEGSFLYSYATDISNINTTEINGRIKVIVHPQSVTFSSHLRTLNMFFKEATC